MSATRELHNYTRARRRERRFCGKECAVCEEDDPIMLVESKDGACLICGETNPDVHERHHVAGKALDERFVTVLCANHHRIASAKQLDYGVNLSHTDERDFLEMLVSFVFGLAAFIAQLHDALIEWGNRLIERVTKLDEQVPAWRTA